MADALSASDHSTRLGSLYTQRNRHNSHSVRRRSLNVNEIVLYLGGNIHHLIPVKQNSNLRQELESLSQLRGDHSILLRVPHTLDGDLVSLDVPLTDLPDREILLLADGDSETGSSVGSEHSSIRGGSDQDLMPRGIGLAQLASYTPDVQNRILSLIVDEMKTAIRSATHKVGNRIQRDCFLASEAIEWLQKMRALTVEQAIHVCRQLEVSGFISHAMLRDTFDGNPKALYRFALFPDQHHRDFWTVPAPAYDPAAAETSSRDLRNLFGLASYVPNVVLKRFVLQAGKIAPPLQENMLAAILYADISGFSSLADRMASLGSRGVEQLTAHLNRFFSMMIDIIYNHGGDIVKFAGDALLVIWPTSASAGIQYSVRVASQCAVALRDELKGFDADGTPLRLHIGVSVGNLAGIYVGTPSRMEFVIAGEPLEDAANCEENAKPGEVFISTKARFFIGSRNITIKTERPTNPDYLGVGPLQLRSILKYAPLSPVTIPIGMDLRRPLESFVPPAVPQHLASGSHDEFFAALRTVTVVFINLGMNVEYSALMNGSALQKLQRVFAYIQSHVAAVDGTIRQFLFDDKGTVAIAAFGLPPQSHEDDPVRAIRFAVNIRKHMKEQEKLEPSIGITTGNVFCGPVGSSDRREYAMVGDVVNVAARIMAQAGGLVLCDRATYQAALSRFSFKTLPPITVKGKQKPQDIFCPRDEITGAESAMIRRRQYALNRFARMSLNEASGGGENSMKLASGTTGEHSPSPRMSTRIVGRERELQVMRDVVRGLSISASSENPAPQTATSTTNEDDHTTTGQLLCFEGEFGSGKSRLAHELKLLCRQAGLHTSTAFSYSSDSLTPFSSFRGLISKLLGLDATTSTPHDEESLSSRTPSIIQMVSVLETIHKLIPEVWHPYVSLLRDVLPELRLQDNATVSRLSGTARAEKTIDLCVEIMRSSGTNCLVLENAQWMDSLSWTVATHLLRRWSSPQHLLVLCIRPASGSGSPSTAAQEFSDFLRAAHENHTEVTTLALAPFTRDQIKEVVAAKFQIPLAGVSDSVSQFLFSRSFGNPVVVLELLSELSEKGQIISVDKGTVQLVSTSDRFSLSPEPKGAETALTSIIMSKLDSLPPQYQLALKVAATIGLEFKLEMLFDVLGQLSSTPIDPKQLDNIIADLEAKGFILPKEETTLVYSFQISTVADVLYKSMLFSQRKAIHTKIAEWLTDNESMSTTIQTQLAHHWKGAESWATALAFMARCGVRSMRHGAYVEAIGMLNDCVATYAKLDAETAEQYRVLLASWHRMLGEAWFSLRNFERALSHLDAGLASLAITIPKNPADIVPGLLEGLFKRIRRVKKSVTSIARYEGLLWDPLSSKRKQVLLDCGGRDAVQMLVTYAVIKMYANFRASSAFCALTAMKQASNLEMIPEYTVAGSICILALSTYVMRDFSEDLLAHVGRYATTLSREENPALKETLARYYYSLACYYAGVGSWRLATSNLALCARSAFTATFPRILGESLPLSLHISFWKGDFVHILESEFDEVLQVAAAHEDLRLRVMASLIRIAVLLCQFHHKTATKAMAAITDELESVAKINTAHAIPTNTIADGALFESLLPARAILLARNKQNDELEKATYELLESIEHREPINMSGSLSIFYLGECVLALHTAGRCGPTLVSRAFSCLTNYSSVFPFAQPALLIFQGDYDALCQRHVEASAKWTQAVECARLYGTRYLEAHALFRLGEAVTVKLAKTYFEKQQVAWSKFPPWRDGVLTPRGTSPARHHEPPSPQTPTNL